MYAIYKLTVSIIRGGMSEAKSAAWNKIKFFILRSFCYLAELIFFASASGFPWKFSLQKGMQAAAGRRRTFSNGWKALCERISGRQWYSCMNYTIERLSLARLLASHGFANKWKEESVCFRSAIGGNK